MLEPKYAIQLFTAVVAFCSLGFPIYQTITERRQRRISGVYEMFQDDDFNRHIDKARLAASKYTIDIDHKITSSQAETLYSDPVTNAAIQSYLTYLENVASAVKFKYADFSLNVPIEWWLF